jgi:glucose/arabinose dehydrogenase
MLKEYVKRLAVIAALSSLAVLSGAAGMASAAPPARMSSARSCGGDNGGIVLSQGFCATAFADNIGHARHLVVGPNGVVYVNTWSGRYYKNDSPPAGGFLVALRDTKGTGKADVVERFGDGVAQGSGGRDRHSVVQRRDPCRSQR